MSLKRLGTIWYDLPERYRRLLPLILPLVAVIVIIILIRGCGPDYPPEEYFVQNQVIATGPESAITAAVESIPQTVVVTEMQRLQFSQLDLPASCPGLPSDARQWAIVLYEIAGSGPEAVQEAIEALQGEDVSVDPDWVTGYPYDPGGSPFFETENNGTQEAKSTLESVFKAQWALKSIGLEYGSQVATVMDVPDAPSGQGVYVGVFDTSPVTGVTADTLNETTYALVQGASPFTLYVRHPTPWAIPAPSQQSRKPPPYINQHGFTVAALVHTVAPSSTIELIRVLEDDNRGTLATLNSAIFGYITRTNQLDPPPTGRVASLSLGIRVPPEQASFQLPRQVESLRLLMAAARCSNIVVVAASGNDSAKSSPPELANLPADWTSVINVAASNMKNGRSCFSNQGDIAAPGGDGRDPGTEQRCTLKTSDCVDGNCPYAVIGPTYTESQDLGYLYWSGTSFAAPMVSGLAARVLEAGGGNLKPADVQAIIECGATQTGIRYLGAGVISATRTLSDCLVLPP